jgi:hypothetical protein
MTDGDRRKLLIDIVHTYIRAITTRDFSAMPYSHDVTLRSPFTSQGVRQQLRGRDSLYRDWWKALVLDPPEREVDFHVTELFFNDELTSVMAEMVITDHLVDPPVTLWAAERFTLNEAGEVVDQINHFDVRDAVMPGWQNRPPIRTARRM